MILVKKKIWLMGLGLSLIIFFLIGVLSSCHYYRLEKKLDPEDAEFLSKVRYIITKQEEHLFLDLPKEERKKFVEDFWKRRDPDPTTEENEFKMEYFNRIERANELFVSEGRPGWLTDRGRIFILFGPPTDRMTYPMGYGPSGPCQEIWYYGGFPVVFLDEFCNGTYRLVTYDLTPLRSINLMYMHELSLAQSRFQQTIRGDSRIFDFKWRVKKEVRKDNSVEGLVWVSIPYTSFWFKEEENELITAVNLRLELREAKGQIVWQHEESYPVKTTEEELSKLRGEAFVIKVPFKLKPEEARYFTRNPGKIYALLREETSGESLRKVLEFRL
jgi:GWxTD domain-containing protein